MVDRRQVKRSHHKMAGVLQTYPVANSVVRSVPIKGHGTTLKRPVIKLAPVLEERFHAENGAWLHC